MRLQFTIILTLLSLCFHGLVAKAGARESAMAELFRAVNSAGKGPFGMNSYQLADRRKSVQTQSGGIESPPRGTLMTVAFRSDTAERLAGYGLYLGNRYTSGYYELHGVAIPGSTANETFTKDHRTLMRSPDGVFLAQALAANTLLERHYRGMFPDSKIAKAYYRRGVADAEHEAKYYDLYLEYLAKFVPEERYLLLSTLDSLSGIREEGGEISLSALRKYVDEVYDVFVKSYGKNSPGTLSMYKVRNGVHNGLSPQVLELLERHIAEHGAGEKVRQLRTYIVAYFTPTLRKLRNAVERAGGAISADVRAQINSVDSLEETGLWQIANALGKLRAAFTDSRDAKILDVIRAGTEVFQKSYASFSQLEDDGRDRVRAFIDIAFANGWVTSANYGTQIANLSADPASSSAQRAALEAVLRGSDAVFESSFNAEFLPGARPVSDWIAIVPEMENFKEELLRASVLPLLAQELTRIPDSAVVVPPTDDATFSVVENVGVAYGYLRFIAASADLDAIPTDSIVVLEELPHKLGVVQGIITEKPQDYYSHVNIKSRSRTPPLPNLYFPQIRRNPELEALMRVETLVRFETTANGYEIRPTTLAEAEAYWSSGAAVEKIVLPADTESREIKSSFDLGFGDYISIGSKAANYAELQKVFAPESNVVLESFGLPFAYYAEFMRVNGFDERAKFIVEQAPINGRDWLVAELKKFREDMMSKSAEVDDDLVIELEAKLGAAYPGVKMRFRSSTNSEDLPNFSGAGLYESTSYEPGSKKKSIKKALRKIWSSVWTQRAFDERAAFGIDHLSVNMGILISPSYPEEIANGVIVSRMFSADGEPLPAVHFNNQIGEASVTNPENGSVGEELMVEFDPNDELNQSKYRVEYFRYSNITGDGVPVTSDAQLKLIASYVLRAHNHFEALYRAEGVDTTKFALDFEFKLDDDYSDSGAEVIVHLKQARPYVVH